MKFLFSLIIILLSLGTSAQVSKTSLIKTVLTDSIIAKYMSNLSGIDSDAFMLFHESGNYIFNKGIVEFEEHNCENTSTYERIGIINKIKTNKTRAIVKIHFTTSNNIRVRLQQDCESRPWRIKSRLIFRNWRFPKKEPRLIYYSFDS